MQRGSSPGVKGWSQCTTDIVPRVRMQLQGGLFQGCSSREQKVPAQESCRVGPRGTTSPAAPALTVGTLYPSYITTTGHKLQLQLHRDGLGTIQQGLGFRVLCFICIIFSDSFSSACLLSRQHSRGSHEDEPVAVRTEGVLHLTRDSALVSAPF